MKAKSDEAALKTADLSGGSHLLWGGMLFAMMGACNPAPQVSPDAQATEPAVQAGKADPRAEEPAKTEAPAPAVQQMTLDERFRALDGCFDDPKKFCEGKGKFDPAQIRDQILNAETLTAFIAKHQAKFETYDRVFGQYDACMARWKAMEYDAPESNLEPSAECWGAPEDFPDNLPQELKKLCDDVKAEAAHAQWLKDHQLGDGYRAMWALIDESDEPDLSDAREKEIAQALKKLMKAGLKLDVPNWEGKIPLLSIRNASLLKALAEEGADLKLKDAHQNGILHQAGVSVAMLNAALEAGVEIDGKNDEGKTPVFYVEVPEILEAFVKAGADLKVKDQKGQTAILNCIADDEDSYWSGAYGLDPECLKRFRDAGVDPNAKDAQGDTLYSHLVQKGMTKKTYDALIAQGADPKAFLPHFMEALKAQFKECQRATRYNPVSMFYDGACRDLFSFYQGDLLQKMIAAGLDVQARDPETGNSFLFYVTSEESVEALLKAGLDLNAKNKEGKTALYFAHAEPRTDAVRAMVEAGAKTDDALLFAHIHSIRGSDMGPDDIYDFDVPCMLLKQDASPYSKDALGKLLSICYSEDYEDGVGCDGKPFHLMLIDLGANVNVRDEKGQTPLMLAEADHCELLKQGADPKIADNEGRNALFYHPEIVDCFSEDDKPNALAKKHNLKALVNARDAQGLTPLMVVDDEEAIEGLIKAGADVKAKDKAGKTVLQHHEDEEIIEMLKAAGAK